MPFPGAGLPCSSAHVSEQGSRPAGQSVSSRLPRRCELFKAASFRGSEECRRIWVQRGGDLALEIAAATEICAIVPEEPASHLLTGVYNADVPKKGERYTPADGFFISGNPRRFY